MLLLTFAVVAILRPVLRPTPEAPRDRPDATRLFLAGGAQSIAAMTLWPGNTILINGWRDAYVAYRVIGGVALVLGDPVGTPDGGLRASRASTCTSSAERRFSRPARADRRS